MFMCVYDVCAVVDILKMRNILLFSEISTQPFVTNFDVNDASGEFIHIMKQPDSKILSPYIISAYELRNITLAG